MALQSGLKELETLWPREKKLLDLRHFDEESEEEEGH